MISYLLLLKVVVVVCCGYCRGSYRFQHRIRLLDPSCPHYSLYILSYCVNFDSASSFLELKCLPRPPRLDSTLLGLAWPTDFKQQRQKNL